MTCQLANVLSSVLATMATNAAEAPSAPVAKAVNSDVAEVRQVAATPRPRKISVGPGRYVELDSQRTPGRNQR